MVKNRAEKENRGENWFHLRSIRKRQTMAVKKQTTLTREFLQPQEIISSVNLMREAQTI